MKLTMNENSTYDEGVRKDETGHYVFDNGFDFDTDIILLTTDTSGKQTVKGLDYYYGYEFNPKIKPSQQAEFRSALKHNFKDDRVFYRDEATRFVTNGLYRMADMKDLYDFGAVISTANYYGEKTLTGLMCQICWDIIPDSVPAYNMQLLKKLCKDVTFDEERARKALMQTNKYSSKEATENAIKSLKRQFEDAKQTGELFKMKLYKSVVGRVGFIDFLKFATPQDQKLYETLHEGTEVLICEDFLTSGATVNEIIRFLNSINPNNKISVFVLINQLRNY